jgi:tetratricopeptide (TPR) repeat protein
MNRTFGPVALCSILVVVTLLIYLPVRQYAFTNYDDTDYVAQNGLVQAGLTWTGVKWAFTTLAANNWHPLTWLSLMLDCQIFGLNAGWSHLVNALFHAANAVLLFIWLLRLTGALWPSAFIAALFAWHPLHVESVAWVAERKDVLSAFFGLLTLLAYTGYARKRLKAESPGTKTDKADQAPAFRLPPLDYFLALLFFALGLMAKPMLVTLPFVLLLLDYWPLQRVPNFELRWSSWSRWIWEKWPFFLLSAASCVVTVVAQRAGVVPSEGYSVYSRLGNAAMAYVRYLFMMVYPVDLAVLYPLPKEIPWEQVAGAIIALAAVSWLIWRARRKRPYLLTGWLWYLGMLVPVIGLVQVGPQALADRYTYLPLIGVFLGTTFGLADWWEQLRQKSILLVPVAILVLGGCLFGTAWQLRFWRNSETLFKRALAITKNNPIIESNLGNALSEAVRPQEAIKHFQAALQLQPDNAMIHDNLGAALFQMSQTQMAIEQFQEALRLKPDDVLAHSDWGKAMLQTGHPQEAAAQFREVLRLNPRDAKACYNLGLALLENGQADEAIAQFQAALQLLPDDAMVHNNLGVALVRAGNLPEAIKHYREALRFQPNFPEAHCDLGLALLQTGQIEKAIAQLQAGLRLRPDLAGARDYLGDALFRWGQILFQRGQTNQAALALQEGLQIHPDNIGARNGLGYILLKLGRADQAITNFQKVLTVQPDNVDALNNLAWIRATCPNAAIRNGTQAVELARQADQFSRGNNPAILATLAAAQAEVGHFADALSTAQKALALANAQTNTAVAEALLNQIKFYQAGSPFRENSLTNTQAAMP